MKWFLNLSTRAKIIISFGLMFILLAIIIVTALSNIISISDSQRELVHMNFKPALDLVEIKADQNRSRASFIEMMLTTDKSKQQSLVKDIKDQTEEIDKSIKELLDINKDDQPFMTKFQELVSAREEYRKMQEEEIALISKGKVDEARQLGIGIQEERYNKIRNISMELGQQEAEHAQQRIALSEKKSKNSAIIFTIIGAGAFLFSMLMTVTLTRVIASPLKEFTAIAERVALGDVDVIISAVDRTDEVGVLAQTFRRMVANIREMANMTTLVAAGDLSVKVMPQSEKDVMGKALAVMVESLRIQTLAIMEGINVLATASAEILASTTLVASGATETASAVNETTATVEEVKQTSQLASQKVRLVADSAQRSLQVSQQGKKSAEDAIQGMDHIREQMETISESIVSLSEQGQAIGEIVATVNDLAEQSNLLAVNAAIEAAKAGEHGKGFAVVAHEVRRLAVQSKEATAQVRTILNDIQKATNAAVMATERGSKVVEAGEKQASDAGEAIRLLADSIAESADASTQIAVSSHQQMVGMEQVAQAMENIKETSTLSVTSTRQAEQSAQNLHELGQKLKGLVEQFKL
jgi:methyl-accepting chemotaxis protein